jgi:allantoicase
MSEPTNKPDPDFVAAHVNVASPRFGTRIVEASDDFFAAKERLILDAAPVFIDDKYDDHGKWMDGWESRRRRDGGHDWCLIKLGTPARLHGVDIDTSHFTGNFPPGASLEVCDSDPSGAADENWREILPQSPLQGDSHNYFAIADNQTIGWLRLHIYPDGGVARLRLYGEAVPDWPSAGDAETELSALKNGGRVITYNDAHYGDVWAILAAGRGVNMGDGWETRRRREPGNDWLIMALGDRGTVERVEIDTAFYKGNYPDGASLQAADLNGVDDVDFAASSADWVEILPRQKLSADAIHEFDAALISAPTPVTHIRLNIFPDGGVSRLRIFGKRCP